MSIQITWSNGIIYVPQSFLTLVSGTTYTLDLDVFRLALKNLEDDAEGMPWPRTHNHNTEVVLAGITFARSVEIINGYTVVFEDGQYGVNCTGANSNLGDVLIRNQVSVSTANSAGLVSTATPGEIADAVWDETATDHDIEGSLGLALLELYELAGLDPSKPLVVTATSRKVPADGSEISQTIAEDGGAVTVQRV